ncbi:MAG: hypothetical protein SFY69_00845 [Planctomycetota bacterium]|nr:hypothetical protein [Planctomycetota bacterium]
MHAHPGRWPMGMIYVGRQTTNARSMAAWPLGGVTLLLVVAFTLRPVDVSPTLRTTDDTRVAAHVGRLAPVHVRARPAAPGRRAESRGPERTIARAPRTDEGPVSIPARAEVSAGILRPRLELLDLPPPARVA